MSDTFDNRPKPPPGFVLRESPAQPAGKPQPPPGFVLQGDTAGSGSAAAPAADSWSRLSVLPFEVNDQTGESRLAMPQIAKDLLDAISLPGRVYRGEINPGSERGLQDAAGLATLLATPSLPRASGKLVTDTGARVPNAVARALRNDAVPVGEIGARLDAMGPAAVNADLGPNVRAMTSALATAPGPGAKTVETALRARQQAAPERIATTLDELLGAAPTPSAVQADIKAGKAALGPAYDAVMAGAQPVDTSALAASSGVANVLCDGPAAAAAVATNAEMKSTAKRRVRCVARFKRLAAIVMSTVLPQLEC